MCLAFVLVVCASAGAQTPTPPIDVSGTSPGTGEAPAVSPPMPATATAIAADPAPDATTSPASTASIPAGTLVEIEILEEISSASRQKGDRFSVRLAEPLVVDGVERLPADLRGIGQVVHAARPRAGGGGGELLVTVRALRDNDRCIPLRGFSLGGNGKDRITTSAALTSALGVVGLLVRGHDLVIPAGSRGTAKLRYDFSDTPTPLATPTTQPTEKESDPCAIV